MTTQTNGTTVTPSTLSAPKNGATSQTRQTTEPKPASAAADPLAEREAQLKAREEALNKRDRVYRDEQRKAADEKKGLGAKLSRLNELEKREQFAKLNPPEYLKGIYGEKWHEVINQTAINGVPPADIIAAEMQKMRDEFKAELEARDLRTREQVTASEAREVEEARSMAAHKSAKWYEANAKEYPVFVRLGDAARVGQILGQRIEQHFMRTNELLTEQQAAEALEADMLGIVETAVEHEKYKSKLQDKLKPANVSASSGAQGVPQQSSTRRTLDNSMTASTSGRAPPRSDAEREARAIAAFNAARAKG
jgi:hypothetical protein